MVEREVTHGAEQNRAARTGDLQRLWRQGMAVLAVSRAAHVTLDQFKAGEVQGLEHAHGFGRDFGANAVASEHRHPHRTRAHP